MYMKKGVLFLVVVIIAILIIGMVVMSGVDGKKKDSEEEDSVEDGGEDSVEDGGEESEISESEGVDKSADKKSVEKDKYGRKVKTDERYLFVDESQQRIQVTARVETKTKNGEIEQKIKIRSSEVISEIDLEEDNGKIKSKLLNGVYREIKIMPDTASKIAISKLESKDISIKLKETGRGNNFSVVYSVEVNKMTKFLGLFRMRYRVTGMIDSETGEMIKIKKPWWSFLTSEVPEMENESLQLIQEISEVIVNKNQEKTLDLDYYFLNAKSYFIDDVGNVSFEVDGGVLTIIPDEDYTGTSTASIIAFNGEDSLVVEFDIVVVDGKVFIQTFQYVAVVGEKVRWKKEIKNEDEKKLVINLPENSENISVVKFNEENEIIGEEKITGEFLEVQNDADRYEVEYYTLEPEVYSESIVNGENITITSPDDVHYTNVVAFRYLQKQVSGDGVELYHVTDKGRKLVEIDKYDLDENGLVDYIEWIVPHLSNQTYLLIIRISNAEHLDVDRNFISDIYEEVKEQDGVWSEMIGDGEYVRVKFEKNLTDGNDITVYARSDSSSTIDIYLRDSDVKIAEISGISSEGYYKTYLTGLGGNFDEFDLRVSGNVEFDYIVDPASLIIIYPDSTTYTTPVTELNYVVSGALECEYSLDGGTTNSSVVCGQNVTGLSADEGSNTWTIYVKSSDTGLWDVTVDVTFTVDTILPFVDVVYPQNTSYNISQLDLNYISEGVRCWYSTDGGATNSSDVLCGTNWSSLSADEGSNTWTVYTNDSAENVNLSSVVFFVDSVAPVIDFGLGTADNNSNFSRTYVYVNVSVIEDNEETIVFYLFNSTGQVNSTSYADFTRTINWIGLADSFYTYNVSVNDSLNNEGSTSSRTISLDNNAPVISFSCDKTLVSVGGILTCSCSAVDNLDSALSLSYTQHPDTTRTGQFTTSCSTTDYTGNSASSSVTYIVEYSKSGGTVPVVSDEELVEGYEKIMGEGWKFGFSIDDESHTLEVNKVLNDSVEISLYSDVQEIILYVGEEKKVELTGDDYYDLAVELVSIEGNKARIKISEIYEEIVGDVVFSELVEEEEPKSWFARNWWLLLVLFIVLLIVLRLLQKFVYNPGNENKDEEDFKK